MTTIKSFSLLDVFEYSNVNLDILTETFGDVFYGTYIAKWSEYCISYLNVENKIIAYLLGKVEGSVEKKEWHGHVTAVTVSPEGRRQGIATYLMDYLEMVSEKVHNAFYVDLFVRSNNKIAINMYKYLQYNIYQIVDKYYSSQEGSMNEKDDAYDMRKSLARDKEKTLCLPTGRTITPKELKYH